MTLTDDNLEKVLRVVTPFILSELEEVVSFENKTEEQRDDIIKVSIKSLEISTILFSKLLKEDSLDLDLLSNISKLVAEDKMSEASDLINKIQ